MWLSKTEEKIKPVNYYVVVNYYITIIYRLISDNKTNKTRGDINGKRQKKEKRYNSAW